MSDTQEELFDGIRSTIAEVLRISPNEVRMDSVLEELGAGSFDFIDITFRLQSKYKVRYFIGNMFDKLEDVVGRDVLSKQGVLTDIGVTVLHQRMPEVESSRIIPGMPAASIQRLFTTARWVSVTKELLNSRPKFCESCGSNHLQPHKFDSLECLDCHAVTACPSGEDLLTDWAHRVAYKPVAP